MTYFTPMMIKSCNNLYHSYDDQVICDLFYCYDDQVI